MDRVTDRHEEANSLCRNFANSSKNWVFRWTFYMLALFYSCNNKRVLETSREIILEINKDMSRKCNIWSLLCMVLELSYRKIHQKYLESFETWYWRMHEIIWTDRMKNKEVLLRVEEGSNYLLTIRSMKANWIGHILDGNCFVQTTLYWRKYLRKDKWREDEKEK